MNWLSQDTVVGIVYLTLFSVAIFSAACVVFLRNTVHCALSLVVTMLCLAGIFLVVQAPFVALIQVLVYAGAIMVLFLYVIMLLNLRGAQEPLIEAVLARRGLAIVLVGGFLLLVGGWWLASFSQAAPMLARYEAVEIQAIATQLLTVYLLPFELTSVLLLVAIVGAILIARRTEQAGRGAEQRRDG